MAAWWLLALAVQAQAGKPATLTIQVTDPVGAPVQDAAVAFPEEFDRHRVNAEDGSWAGSWVYPKEGDDVELAKGTAVSFRAGAPGYAVTTVDHVVKGRRPVAVALQPLPAPTLSCVPADMHLDAEHGAALVRWAHEQLGMPDTRTPDQAWCLLGALAYGSSLDWQAKSRSYVDRPTDDDQAADIAAQRRTHEAAREWLDWAAMNQGDTTVAAALCQSAQPVMEPCQ